MKGYKDRETGGKETVAERLVKEEIEVGGRLMEEETEVETD